MITQLSAITKKVQSKYKLYGEKDSYYLNKHIVLKSRQVASAQGKICSEINLVDKHITEVTVSLRWSTGFAYM